MSDNLKPLIFVSPLSDTLKKLREVIGPNAEAEGIEVYDAENMEEACQLIPSVGQSVTLMSHPKHCALTLQKNRKFFKKMNSKMILLSSKSIPRKTLDKFMKVGLTENIVEPVNPKTLLYKVRLQLKSIATAKEESEMNRKFEQDSSQQEEKDDFSLKKKQSTDNNQEQEEEEEKEVREKKKAQEIEMENYSNVQRKEQQEESIETHYKGKNSQQETSIEEETNEKKKYKEEEIDTHYKGQLTKSLELEEEDPHEKSSHDIDVDVDEMDALRSQVSLEVEQDLQKKRELNQEEAPLEQEKPKKNPKLELQEDASKDSISKKEAEDLGGHYKGQLSKGLEVEDDESDFKEKKLAEKMDSMMEGEAASQLDIEDDDEPSIKEDSSDELYNEEKNKFDALDIEDDKQSDKEKLLEVEAETQKKGSDYLKDEDPLENEESQKKSQLEIEEENLTDDPEAKKVDEIDKYLRSKSAQKLEVDEDKEDLFQDKKEKQKEAQELEDSPTLEVVDENKERELENEEQIKKEDTKERTSTSLDIQEDPNSHKLEKEDVETQEKDLLAKKPHLEIDDEKSSRKSSETRSQEKDQLKRSNAKSDHIKTHYSSREGIKHGNGDWDSKWNKPQKPLEDDFPKQENENALFIEKEDHGEQTINYEKLKADFDAISYDRLPNKKKISTEYDGPVAKIKTFGKTIFSELENQDVIVQVEEVQDELDESTQVFEPQPLGIDHAVLVLNYYMKEETQIHQVCKLISKQILKNYSGSTAFFSYDQKSNHHFPLYRHLVEGELGEAPRKPTEQEKEGLSKSELKSLIKEYDNDLLAFNQQKEELTQDWLQVYGEDISLWQQATTPSWKDHTFQNKENYYVVPFFEGKRKLGFAVVCFEESFNPMLEKPLEVILETARGLFLESSQNEKENTNNSSKSKKENNSKEKGGFLSSLWKKVAS